MGEAVKDAIAVIPFYYCYDEERAAITRKIFHHYANVACQLGNITFLGIGSEGELSKDIWAEHHDPAFYFEYSQAGWPDTLPSGGSDEIRDKFNFSIQQARGFDPARVWLIQSDDLITANFFMPSDADLVGVGAGLDGGCYIWKNGTDEYLWWQGKFPYMKRDTVPFCGGNMGFSISLLDEVDWKPYVFEGDEFGVQKWARIKRKTFDARQQGPDDFQWWLIKGERCLNPLGPLFAEFVFHDVPAEQIRRFDDYWESL